MSAWFHAPYEDVESWEGPFETAELAEKDGRETYTEDGAERTHLFVATGDPLDPAEWLPSADVFIENMMDECASDDSDVDPDLHLIFAEGAKAALEAALAAWCKTCVSCSWYTVGGGIVKRVDLP